MEGKFFCTLKQRVLTKATTAFEEFVRVLGERLNHLCSGKAIFRHGAYGLEHAWSALEHDNTLWQSFCKASLESMCMATGEDAAELRRAAAEASSKDIGDSCDAYKMSNDDSCLALRSLQGTIVKLHINVMAKRILKRIENSRSLELSRQLALRAGDPFLTHYLNIVGSDGKREPAPHLEHSPAPFRFEGQGEEKEPCKGQNTSCRCQGRNSWRVSLRSWDTCD